jgi:hypothetical protein
VSLCADYERNLVFLVLQKQRISSKFHSPFRLLSASARLQRHIVVIVSVHSFTRNISSKCGLCQLPIIDYTRPLMYSAQVILTSDQHTNSIDKQIALISSPMRGYCMVIWQPTQYALISTSTSGFFAAATSCVQLIEVREKSDYV